MSNEELVEQVQQGVNPGDNMELLYIQNKGFISQVVKKFKYIYTVNNNKTSIPIIEYQDLMNEAYFGLAEAAKRYEDSVGVLFMTYASFWIREAIIRYLEYNGRTVRLPVAIYSKVMQYKRLITAYEMQLGRKQLCRYLGVKDEGLNAIKKTCLYDDIHSLDGYIPGTDDLLMEECIPDQSIDIENDVVNGMIEKSIRTEIWQIVKYNVTPEENIVITARYWKSMSLEATGRLIGKPRNMTRQIEAKALKKLRMSRIRRQLEEKFEINYARVYRGSFKEFKYTGNSIVEDIAIRNLKSKIFAT